MDFALALGILAVVVVVGFGVNRLDHFARSLTAAHREWVDDMAEPAVVAEGPNPARPNGVDDTPPTTSA